ncbi:GNAT family N-acetyltransferase [Clostridium taeniosporum]|uniref:N-acetyltransferase n=1 Tax=Clostridium taeniosporum TaxID=394958 RepID=A0A1D7XLM0_9CLOT|nr:GNAT family N-acetyltransferase [Clostridium taeniosporum]AOR24167.1 N-acetyltransferase [Clostridium taeniosporum]
MQFRKSIEKDINSIMKIINQAQQQLKEQCVDQWQNNYPNVDTIMEDIKKGYSYVLLEDEEIIATVAISFDGEETYNIIYDGKWLSNYDYVVIHRMAVKDEYKGKDIASKVIGYVERKCLDKGIHSIKIDTHIENQSMQNVIKKNNFKYCGTIYLEDKSKRIAFEKII